MSMLADERFNYCSGPRYKKAENPCPECGEPRWNDIDRGKPKNSEKNPSDYNFVEHVLHGVTRRRPGPLRRVTAALML
jgi:hypothetical protein